MKNSLKMWINIREEHVFCGTVNMVLEKSVKYVYNYKKLGLHFTPCIEILKSQS